jgi:hypothetical protein
VGREIRIGILTLRVDKNPVDTVDRIEKTARNPIPTRETLSTESVDKVWTRPQCPRRVWTP